MLRERETRLLVIFERRTGIIGFIRFKTTRNRSAGYGIVVSHLRSKRWSKYGYNMRV